MKIGPSVELNIEESGLDVSLDSNQDGEKSVELIINPVEGFGELFNKGTQVVGVKALTINKTDKGVELVIDSDKDGTPVAKLSINAGEAVEELIAKFTK